MPTKPSTLPRWAETAGGVQSSEIVEPSSGKKDSGWVDAELPPHNFFNWYQNLVYRWIEWLQNALLLNDNSANSGTLTVTGAPSSNLSAGVFTGDGVAYGVQGIGGSSVFGAAGVFGQGGAGAGGGHGVVGQAVGANSYGVEGLAAAGASSGAAGGSFGGGSGSAAGVKGFGGAAGGVGGVFTANGGNGDGVQGIGHGSGNGVTGTGGATNGDGVHGVGTGSGSGVSGVGGATGEGGTFSSSSNATAVRGSNTGGGQAGYFDAGGGTGVALQCQGNASHAGFKITPLGYAGSDPLSVTDGEIWVDTASNTIKIRLGGVTKTFTVT